ncbi:MAG TPA: T9SS type A sorting domain-containing protein, partial [Flavobacteriales bacterium]|nr:T9SS type A sorting domain-containing protein [Flavobacteriales bacterium]
TNSCGTVADIQTLNVGGIGITEVVAGGLVQVYPNPTTGLLTIKSKSTIEGAYVVNAGGQRVMLQSDIGTAETTFDVSALARGMYIITVVTADGIYRTQVTLVK